MANREFEWRAFEYLHYEKTADWFWALGIITISIAVASILFKNILFAIFILLSGSVLGLYAKRRPQIISCRLTERGLQFGRNLYQYNSLESFWVETEDGEPKILLQSKRAVMPLIIVPILDRDAGIIRDFLSRYLREEEKTEPLSQKIMQFLGF